MCPYAEVRSEAWAVADLRSPAGNEAIRSISRARYRHCWASSRCWTFISNRLAMPARSPHPTAFARHRCSPPTREVTSAADVQCAASCRRPMRKRRCKPSAGTGVKPDQKIRLSLRSKGVGLIFHGRLHPVADIEACTPLPSDPAILRISSPLRRPERMHASQVASARD
jgi:hypothetical protein